MILTIKDQIELALSLARHYLMPDEPDTESALSLVRGCPRLLQLYRPPDYVNYNPGTLFKKTAASLEHERRVLNVEPVTDAVGDTRQVLELVELLAESAELDQDAVLLLDVFQQEDRVEKEGVPCLALSFDGTGSFPQKLLLSDALRLPMPEVESRWTLATRGGRIDKAPNGLLLRLTGVRVLPQVTADLEPLRLAMEETVEACAGSETNCAPVLLEKISAALKLVDGKPEAEIADLPALANDVISKYRPELEEGGVAVEALYASELPPIHLRRDMMQGLFRRLLDYAVAAEKTGAAVTFLFDYDSAARSVVFVTTITGVDAVTGHDAYLASLKRIVEEAHAGNFDAATDKAEITVTIDLPDAVGKALDEWIPGCEAFSDQSKKVLRLLKSGGPVPPAELLLEGVVEEELGRWLPARLEEAPAGNVAHDIAADVRKAALQSPDRLKRALTQIQKGKPKREIAKRPSAAEIVWAYRTDERRRAAIGAANLSREQMETLAKLLAQPEGGHVEILRMLAAVATRQ